MHGADDPIESDVSKWIDASVTDDDVVRRSVVVGGLLPGTRYRFRYTSTNPLTKTWLPWSLALLSDWYLTAGEEPSKVTVLHATPWEKQAMMVQWKLPRINGSLITTITVQRMRLRPSHDDDSDSEGEQSNNCVTRDSDGEQLSTSGALTMYNTAHQWRPLQSSQTSFGSRRTWCSANCRRLLWMRLMAR